MYPLSQLCIYSRYLHPFEDFYRKLGFSAMCGDIVSRNFATNSSSSKRGQSDSHRSLHLFKNRYLSPNAALATPMQKKVIGLTLLNINQLYQLRIRKTQEAQRTNTFINPNKVFENNKLEFFEFYSETDDAKQVVLFLLLNYLIP